jgi:hypothetical protein
MEQVLEQHLELQMEEVLGQHLELQIGKLLFGAADVWDSSWRWNHNWASSLDRTWSSWTRSELFDQLIRTNICYDATIYFYYLEFFMLISSY